MTKWKLSLLLLSVAIVALLLSGCFLPPKVDNTGPTISVSAQSLSVESGQPFTVQVSATDPSGIEYIQATFMGKTEKSETSPASFTFVAPQVTQASEYTLTITAVDNSKNHNSTTKNYQVAVWPTESGTLTTSVQLNNANGIYVYPVGPQQSGAVLISVKVLKGAQLVNSVNVFVDGKSIPSTSTASLMSVKAQEATSTQAEWTFFYPINAQTAGPHTYYAVFYNKDGKVIQKTNSGWFYITYPAKQNVELGVATPLYNGEYLTGKVSFTATATDYTSNYEALLIEGPTPSTKVLVSYPATSILNFEAATKIVNKAYDFNIDTASLKDGNYTFSFIDKSVDGATKCDSMSYVIDNTPPTLKISYKGIPSSGDTLYVGASPVTFDVYAYDTNWMSAQATLGNTSITLTKNSTTLIDVSGMTNGATATFSATVKDEANHESSVKLLIVRDTVPPAIHSASISGLATVNGVPNAAATDITVTASVTDTNLKSVAFVLSIDGPTYMFPMTKNASGLWTATVDLTKVLPGTYNASIIATDLALNSATAETSPSVIHVYKTLSGIFTTSLETTPSAPVNGYVKSAMINVTVNASWIYAIKSVCLYNGTALATSVTGSATSMYELPITESGTYTVVVKDTVNATYTDGKIYVVKIDDTAPSMLEINPSATVITTDSETFTVSATDAGAGIASLTLEYQSLGATGMDNGPWSVIGTVSASSGTLTWNNINMLPDGKYNLKLIAVDGVGNSASTTTYMINDYSGKPNVTFVFPATWTNSTLTIRTVKVIVNNEGDVSVVGTELKGTTVVATVATSSDSYFYPKTFTWSGTYTSVSATTYLVEYTVKDMANNSVSASKVVGFDNIKPTIVTTSAPATVAGNATFTVTIHATDNLSAIKSVSVGGIAATLASTPSTNEFGTLDGTYTAIVTAPNLTTSTRVTFDIAVFDNAGNEATSSVSVYVDVTAPTITVKLVNNNGAQTISNGASEINYTSTPASITWLITTDSGATAEVSGSIEGPATTDITTTFGMLTINVSGPYTITIKATNPINGKVETFIATKTIVIDNTAPTATLDIPSTVNIANMNTAVATYTATDTNFKAATLTINGVSKALTEASSATVLLNEFNLAGINGATLTATLTVEDKALNITTSTKEFYVDTVAPTAAINKTLYESGGTYYLDIQFSEPMNEATLNSLYATDVVFDVDGVYYYIANSASNTYVNDNGKGLLRIAQLLTTSGATTNVLPLAGNTVTITFNATRFEDIAGNALNPTTYTVTFQNVSSPKPVNP